MNSFILIVTFCVPGAWNQCKNSALYTEKVPNIPTLEVCEKAKNKYLEGVQYNGVTSAMCIQQIKETK